MVVIGAGGNVGGAVVRSLIAAGIRPRAVGRDPEALARRNPGVECAPLDLADPATFAPAVAHASGLFLIRPPAISRVGPLNALVDEAIAAGVEHVVFASVAGAQSNPVVPHHRVETHLTSSPVSWTILRPGFFAQNLGDAYRADIVRDRRLYLPAGEGRVAFVDVRDVGDVVARVFADPAAHAGRAHTLTGPEALTFAEVAELLTAELGEPVSYVPATVAGYLRHLGTQDLPPAQRLVQAVLHAGLRSGQAEVVDPTLGELLGRPPRTLAEYVRDHRHLWAAEGRR
ncbi:MAG: SDR family NAD(P)-dependent oxidoreductase [Actinobacteria bacterium]|nr:SDR family NAD(P)-dependent oxidoreductase [Actinomycetota bacterium]